MFIFVILYIVLAVIAIRGAFEPSPDRAEFDKTLEKMNSRTMTCFILGAITILAALLPIVDSLLDPVSEERLTYLRVSPIFHQDYTDDWPLLTVVFSWIVAVGWLIWIIAHLNYQVKNKEKLEKLVSAKERRLAAMASYKAEVENENNQLMSDLSSRYGKPDKIIKIDGNRLSSAMLVFSGTRNLCIQSRVIPFSDLVSCEIKDDSHTTVVGKKEEVTKTSTGSAVGRAVVGSLVAGPAGAIIGGATAKKKTEVIDNTKTITNHHYYVIVNLASISDPVISIDCGKSSPKMAEEIKAIISGIIAKNKQANASHVGVGSIADELTKLAALKEQGILTEVEFSQQKQRLLSGEPQLVEIPAVSEDKEVLTEPLVLEDTIRAEVMKYIEEGQDLKALDAYNKATQCGLLAASEYVENLKKELGID